MCLIDEERGWQARRRVIRWKKYKREFLFRLEIPIMKYIYQRVSLVVLSLAFKYALPRTIIQTLQEFLKGF